MTKDSKPEHCWDTLDKYGMTYLCGLDKGHDGAHKDGMVRWSDD